MVSQWIGQKNSDATGCGLKSRYRLHLHFIPETILCYYCSSSFSCFPETLFLVQTMEETESRFYQNYKFEIIREARWSTLPPTSHCLLYSTCFHRPVVKIFQIFIKKQNAEVRSVCKTWKISLDFNTKRLLSIHSETLVAQFWPHKLSDPSPNQVMFY